MLRFQVNKLKEWLIFDENPEKVPSDELLTLMNDLDNCRVAMKGSGVYPVTYSGLAKVQTLIFLFKWDFDRDQYFCTFSSESIYSFLQMAGQTVTYFIICVQA